MTACVAHADIKRRYLELKDWAEAYTAKLEADIQSRTALKRLHCFVMDQFEEAYPDEHLSRDKAFVFLSLRVAVDLKGLSKERVHALKAKVSHDRGALQILSENFHDSPFVLDLDWHISERERVRDQGVEFANFVIADCMMLARQLETLAQGGEATTLESLLSKNR